MRTPRGIRNNNPGNIRHGENWNGLAEQQPDPDFCTFVAPVYGIRAMGRILLNYQRRHNLNTVREIINRWAPPVENDTQAYAAHVARVLGVDPDAQVDVATLLETFLEVIIQHENGQNPYDASLLAQGADMARA